MTGAQRRTLAVLALGAGLSVGAAAPPAAAGDSLVEACISAAADLHRVPAGVIVLLLNVENGRLGEVSGNSNKTVDIGPMQVNDSWLAKIAAHWRATREAAFLALRDNFCANVEGGAWILRQALDEAGGDLWEGVARYHSHTPKYKLDYMRQVWARALRLRRQAAAELASADGATGR